MKMGFKGRLGKNEDGVTRQLEVKVRPGLSGLGFGNFKEATTLKVSLKKRNNVYWVGDNGMSRGRSVVIMAILCSIAQ